VVKRYPSKLDMRVRFPLPAPFFFLESPEKLLDMKKAIGFLMIGAVLGLMSPAAHAYTAAQIAAVKSEVSADKSKVLAIVSSKVSESPEDAGAIVKAAIQAAGADAKLVAAIVKAAITAAPDQADAIAEAALSVAPDAAEEVQAVLALFSTNNPLDFPGVGIGSGGHFPEFSARGPLFLINPPFTSDVNP
jgi:hypothetical protein